MTQTALIGLGASLGPRHRTLQLAAASLEAWTGIEVVARSRVYLSCPLGPAKRPFLNAALRARCEMDGLELLDACKAIEDRLGRQRSGRWMDRVIDLDILIFGDQPMDHPRLEVPHPQLLERPFALVPAAEIGGDLVHPGVGKALRECPVPSPLGLVLRGCL